jgi:hypothetical protein
MFEVSADETTALATSSGLVLLMERAVPTLIKRTVPVIWKLLVFEKG